MTGKKLFFDNFVSKNAFRLPTKGRNPIIIPIALYSNTRGSNLIRSDKIQTPCYSFHPCIQSFSLESNSMQKRGLKTLLKPLTEIKTHRNKSFRAYLKKPLEAIERFADRMYSRWLYFRYEGSLGPQPESFTVKQNRKGVIFNTIIITVLLIIVALGQNFNPHFNSPFIVGLKVWPDNIEEYRDVLDAKSGKVSSSKSPTSPPPPSPSPSPTTPISS